MKQLENGTIEVRGVPHLPDSKKNPIQEKNPYRLAHFIIQEHLGWDYEPNEYQGHGGQFSDFLKELCI